MYYALKGERFLWAEAFKNPDFLLHEGRVRVNDPDLVGLEIGSANGVGQAKDLAKIFDLLSQARPHPHS